MQKLRYYQQEAVDTVISNLKTYDRVLFTAATGTGKTTIIAELCRRLREEGKTILCLAHRSELITQMYWRIRKHLNLDEFDISIEQADERANNSPIVVGTVQTVASMRRLQRDFDTVIADECHHFSSEGNQKILDKYGVGSGSKLIGCTATAKRADKTGLFARWADDRPVLLVDKKTGKEFEAQATDVVFDKLVYEYGIVKAIEDGYLVDVVSKAIRTKTDLRGVKKTGGDFNQKELSKRVNNAERTNIAINGWITAGWDTDQTIVFCVDVQHTHDTAKLWCEAGYKAIAIDGTTPQDKRKQAFEDFAAKRVQVLVNCGIATEGTDIPNIECVVLVRPTRSWSLLCQMTGRGLRILPDVIESSKGTWALKTVEERVAAIAASPKPKAHVLQLIDIAAKDTICTIPQILDNPIMRSVPDAFDMEDASLTEAMHLMETVKGEDSEWVEQTLGDFCPVSFKQLKVVAEHISLLKSAKNQQAAKMWSTDGDGWKLRNIPPRYSARFKHVEGDRYALKVSYKEREGGNAEPLVNQFNIRLTPEQQKDMSHYFEAMGNRIRNAVSDHQDKLKAKNYIPTKTQKGTVMQRNYGTAGRMSQTDIELLKQCHFTEDKINSMALPKAQAIANSIRKNWKGAQK